MPIHRPPLYSRASPSFRQRLPGLLSQQDGLTLVELLVTLAVLAIALMLGTADLSRLAAGDRTQAVVNELRGALELARLEAVRRGSSVVVCRRRRDEERCLGASSRGRLSWQSGWLVFVDADRDRQYQPGGEDVLIRLGSPLRAGVQLKWNRGDYLRFSPAGGLSSRNGSFCLDWAALGEAGRAELSIPYTGRIQLTLGQCRSDS